MPKTKLHRTGRPTVNSYVPLSNSLILYWYPNISNNNKQAIVRLYNALLL